MKRPNDLIVIYVRPALSGAPRPIEAFIGGAQVSGWGHTVPDALEDLFTSAKAGRIARTLEKDVAAALANGYWPDRRA